MVNDEDIRGSLSDQVLNSSRSMLSVINRDYVYEKVNPRFCRTLSLDQCSVKGKSLKEIWGTENFEKNIKTRIDKCLNGETVQYQAEFETSEGRRYYDIIFRPIHSENGNVTHLLAETFDITDIREAANAFRQIEREYRNLETNLPVGFLRCRTDGSIVHINKACQTILGLDAESIHDALNFSEFYAEKSVFSHHVNLLSENSTFKLGRTRLRSAEGRDIFCRLTGFINTGISQSEIFIDYAIEDITREQYLEERLAQAQRLETVGALAGGLAHDFNNILTTIYGYAELSLDEARQNAYLSDNLSRILSAVNKARSLTQQILTFSRHIEQEKVPVNPWLVLKETLTLVKSSIGSGIRLVDNTFDTGTIVYADPTQLFRVFMNLINNAIQAMENKGGELIISQKTENINRFDVFDTATSEKKFYEVTISDTGTGMEKSVIDRIFEPFFTTKPIGKGTGLGLSVVHGIINELGGLIDVESKSGEGTTFTVRIPLTDHLQSLSVNSVTPARIICISDNVSESRMLCLGLEMAGYSLSYATSPETFIKLVLNKKNTPDLVLYMDDLHGFPISDLNLIYRKSKIKVPLLIISGSQDLILEESFLNSDSARHFLHKPVSLREVRNEIEVAVKKK